ncbi:MAG: DUF1292 domain-containing protein [Furfurilactobacillus sp.]|jgi:uncharacterized protein YrzB (UPF0473 family)|nr:MULTISPECIES: DUF1292 domain-containing protein [Furfurilactobacillus]MCF6161656.1 DUF1292 domain-containing protein [Furfurilactobacillus milii]MCF6164036.1 DUF1292 domain-containing protein [Furfurilactobacillus milii]MCF6166529.1 DUF1292 domain-containing protein [Furfurilactobacillus rossiae]MCF6419075.1 DUF1292 domain-containing protein [Furfurilactobacillus milii]MCH4011113.1 DUF1292 domain-containing protein [Furfurilactobacillus sp.]
MAETKHSGAEDNDEQQITLVDDNGNETLYNVLFTFKSDDYGKSYILLYPASAADDEEVDIQAYAFDPEEDGSTEGELSPIENDDEWDMVEEMLNTFLDDDSNMSN